MKKSLPIGNDDFRKLRKNGSYYVDKTLMIKEFIEMKDEVALIARPRRFGKTLNMTMLREFFDIREDSRDIFDGLAIMETEYASQINSRPVIYFTMKGCKGSSVEEMTEQLKLAFEREYENYEEFLRNKLDHNKGSVKRFYKMMECFLESDTKYFQLSSAITVLLKVVKDSIGIAPILLIDEYDQPIMSSYEYGYHEEMGAFFANLYGDALKGNPDLGQALITGVQRMAKESIFSQLNNPVIYTVSDRPYAPYFGLTTEETQALLKEYDLELDENVKYMYDGYQMGGIDMYNPWSVLNYAGRGFLDYYWVNTSSNYLIRQALGNADRNFWESFDLLAVGQTTEVWLTLDTAYVERSSNYSLWGLLVNAGYLTIAKRRDAKTAFVKIPNGEVMAAFQMLISEIAGYEGLDLQQMFSCLKNKDRVQAGAGCGTSKR